MFDVGCSMFCLSESGTIDACPSSFTFRATDCRVVLAHLSSRLMPVRWIEQVGRNTNNTLAAFGDFCVFAGRTFRWLCTGWFRWKDIRTLFPLMYEVGVRSVPVIAVTGAFIGMVMAVETHTQFKSIGQEDRIGSIISL